VKTEKYTRTIAFRFRQVLLYMTFSASPSRRSMKGATINGVTYEGVAQFIYLGTLTSNDNSVQKDIQRRILAGNRTYFAAISLFRNRLLSRATKIRLYKTVIRPAVTYGAETWTMTKKEEQALLIFDRKIFRTISSSSSCSGMIRFDSCSLYPQNEIGPSISSSAVLCVFVLLVYIVVLV